MTTLLKDMARLVSDLYESPEQRGGTTFAEAIQQLREAADDPFIDDVVIVRYQGHEIIYSLTEPNGDVSAFEDKVPAWAKAMGILHALRVILEVQELQSILYVACVRMREIYKYRALPPDTNA